MRVASLSHSSRLVQYTMTLSQFSRLPASSSIATSALSLSRSLNNILSDRRSAEVSQYLDTVRLRLPGSRGPLITSSSLTPRWPATALVRLSGAVAVRPRMVLTCKYSALIG